MDEIKVLISYSHRDGDKRNILANVLDHNDGLTALYDWRNVDPASNARLDDMLSEFDNADAMIAIITSSSLASPMCRDEWILARDRTLPVILLQEQGTTISDDARYILYHGLYKKTWSPDPSEGTDNYTDACHAVAAHITKIQNDSRATTSRQLRRLFRKHRDTALRGATHKGATWQTEVVKRVIDTAGEEIRRLTEEQYNVSLSIERDFIVRATPIFQEATRVCATSLDRVSRFWLSEEHKENAIAYTKAQPPETTRLFIFDGPASAHLHRSVLAAHYETYGIEGCVLLCDRTAYDNILDHVFSSLNGKKEQQAKDGLRHKDFAFLSYEELLDGQDAIHFEATLTETHVSCRRLGQIGEGRRRMLQVFDELAKIPPGSTDEKYGVLRWSPEFTQDQERWKRAIDRAFIEHRVPEHKRSGEVQPLSGDVWHLVFFAKEVADDDNFLKTVRREVNSMRVIPREAPPGGKLIKEVLFAKWNAPLQKMQMEARDGQFDGKLITESLLVKQYPFCLMLRFETLDDLRAYYSDKAHAECRRRIFEAFPVHADDREVAIKKLYKLADAQPSDREMIYKGIEGLASRHIQRVDFVEQVDLDMMIDLVEVPSFSVNE